jgi:hypothetical protein
MPTMRELDIGVNPIVSKMQAEIFAEIFPLVHPSRRIAIAAVVLGMSTTDILKAAGLQPRNIQYYATERNTKSLNSSVMLALSRVLGVEFSVLWDEDTLADPSVVIRSPIRVTVIERPDNEKSDSRSDVSNVRCIDDARKCG